MKQFIDRAKFDDEMESQIAILPCRNGIETASDIIKHIHAICKERRFKGLSYLKGLVEIDTRDFIDGEIRPKIRDPSGESAFMLFKTLLTLGNRSKQAITSWNSF